MPQISPLVEDVRQRGDAAVKEYTKKFDKVDQDWVCRRVEVCGSVGSTDRSFSTE